MVGYTPVGLVAFVLCCLAVIFLSQALCCLLGWLLHLLLSRINKSLASAVYMVLFLGIYFILPRRGNISTAITQLPQQRTSKALVWFSDAPWSVSGNEASVLAAFLVICGSRIRRFEFEFSPSPPSRLCGYGAWRRCQDYGNLRAGSTVQALMFKERKRFLGCPVYLTNMGLGLVMILALAIAGAVFRKKVLEFFNLIPGLSLLMPLLICAVLGFLVSSTCISTPSVSLEGKSIWILKSLPLAPRQILLAKLRFHNVLVVPIAMASGLILSLAYGCGPVDTLLVTVFPGLLGLLCGLLGMVCGLQWARLDWLTEAHPCKQSVALAVTMLGVMAWLLAGGLVYGFLLHSILTLTEFLALFTLLTTLCCLVLYRTLVTWGAKKWEAL